tara:strand:+ start:2479 stop:2880 length:402 start_codon:yes stop_codon:yes gene_type:complete
MKRLVVAAVLAGALASSATAQKSLEASINGMRDLITEPLARWQNAGPAACTNQDLTDASLSAIRLTSTLRPDKYGPGAAIKAGIWALDVGDAARKAGCRDVALRMYEHVMRAYVGSGFAGLRDRARVGIDALR